MPQHHPSIGDAVGYAMAHNARLAAQHDAARQATGQADTTADTCRTVDVDGTPVHVRGSGDWTDEDQRYMSEIVRAAKRKFEAEAEPAVNPACTNCNGGAAGPTVADATAMLRRMHADAGLPAPVVGQPAAAPDTDARPPRTAWRTESIETDGFETTWTVEDETR
ncbi:hypothetical protein [Streptomyces cinereoruber]|uniref:hypothetical protein n=1 Tax=Streptomyces cinereoruber TaxID=67260 RepID=UPI003643E21B